MIRSYDPPIDEGVVTLAWKHVLLDVPPLSVLHRDALGCAWALANRYVDDALRDDTLTISVAVNPEGADHVWGFLARTPVACEAIWVKPAYRHLGIARELWDAAGFHSAPLVHCRSWSPWAERLAARWRLVYAPRGRYTSVEPVGARKGNKR